MGDGLDAAAAQAGYLLAAKFFGSVLPAHRRRVMALSLSDEGGGHAEVAANAAGGDAAGAEAAPVAPDGANAAHAAGPLALPA
jgi:hypothetical protein